MGVTLDVSFCGLAFAFKFKGIGAFSKVIGRIGIASSLQKSRQRYHDILRHLYMLSSLMRGFQRLEEMAARKRDSLTAGQADLRYPGRKSEGWKQIANIPISEHLFCIHSSAVAFTPSPRITATVLQRSNHFVTESSFDIVTMLDFVFHYTRSCTYVTSVPPSGR